tara:strand:- start:5045 stop:5908 length:864 start_codon:yes stop_codon:yes gene_type:complete
VIVHFSCGAASTVSALLCILEKPKKIELVYTDPGLEHKDNKRFLRDFEKLTGHKVTILKSKKYKSPMDVFESRNYLSGVNGAPCTSELKIKVASEYLGSRIIFEDNIFGFDPKEQKRANKYKNNNPELNVRFPLIEQSISKDDCYYIIDSLGLDLPYMYKLGYKNANCTGCVKAESLGYWAAIREDFPKVFNWYANFERKIGAIDPNTGKPKGAAINKRYEGDKRIRVFLDEIPADFPPKRNISFTCGYSCGAQDMEVEAVKELTKEPSLIAYIKAQDIKNFLKENK